MEEMTMSFRAGRGSYWHNIRLTKDGRERKTGDPERRYWNKFWDWEKEQRALKNLVVDAVKKYNDRMMSQRHPERMKNVEEVLAGMPRREYIVQFGNRVTGCAYEPDRNEKGELLNGDGKVIKPWDTRKPPRPKDGVKTRRKDADRFIDALFEFSMTLLEENPNFYPTDISIHLDEDAGIHCHIGGVWVHKKKNGIGIGFSQSAALKEQEREAGIHDVQVLKNNALTRWTKKWRMEKLPEIGLKYGFVKVDGGAAGRAWEPIGQYRISQEKRCEEKERLEAERERFETEKARFEDAVREARKKIAEERADIQKERKDVQKEKRELGVLREKRRLARQGGQGQGD